MFFKFNRKIVNLYQTTVHNVFQWRSITLARVYLKIKACTHIYVNLDLIGIIVQSLTPFPIFPNTLELSKFQTLINCTRNQLSLPRNQIDTLTLKKIKLYY